MIISIKLHLLVAYLRQVEIVGAASLNLVVCFQSESSCVFPVRFVHLRKAS